MNLKQIFTVTLLALSPAISFAQTIGSIGLGGSTSKQLGSGAGIDLNFSSGGPESA